MSDCYECKYAIFDYEEYYGGYKQQIVTGCKKDKSPEECESEEEEEGD